MRMPRLIGMMALCAAAAAAIATPQKQQVASAAEVTYTPGTPWVGQVGITETVAEIMARDAAQTPEQRAEAERPLIRPRLMPPVAPDDATGAIDVSGGATNPPAPYLPQAVALSVLGSQTSESAGFPPDSMGAIGPTQFFVTVNGRFKTLNKTTGAPDGAVNTTPNVFFNSVRNGSSMSDPRVRFDRLSNRWFVVMINVSTPNRVCIAVSSGPTISNTASFTFYFFQQDLVSTVGDVGALLDYPSLGVDNNALYIAGNMFAGGSSFTGVSAFVVRKTSVTGAGPIVVTAFRSIGNIRTAMGVDNDNPTATEGYFIGTSAAGGSQLIVKRITNPGGTPAISSDLVVSVPATANPQSVPVLGGTANLDALDTRLYNAKLFLNSITGVRTLWTSHSIRSDRIEHHRIGELGRHLAHDVDALGFQAPQMRYNSFITGQF